MCYKPIHIYRKANGFHAFDVPCGCCESCNDNYLNSWIMRANQEYIRTRLSDGTHNTHFITLTYDNAHLPEICLTRSHDDIIKDDDGNVVFRKEYPDYIVSCWDKEEVKSFLHSLYDKLQYFIITSKYNVPQNITKNGKRVKNPEYLSLKRDVIPFKYILTSERGSSDCYVSDSGRKRFGTARPHYHLMTFVYYPEITSKIFNDAVKSLWSYGRVYDISLNRNPSTCIAYVLKYSTKQSRQDFRTSSLDPDMKSKYAPFNLFSKGIGKSFFAKIQNVDDFNYFITHGVTITLGKYLKTIPLPQYYTRACYFETSITISNRTLKDYLSKPDFLWLGGIRYDCRDINFFVPKKLKKQRKITFRPTALYDTFYDKTLYNKSVFYAHYLQQISSKSDSYISEFQEFIYKRLYQECDQSVSQSDNVYYQDYLMVKNHIANHARNNHILKDNLYKSNLVKAKSSNPNLFSFNPL